QDPAEGGMAHHPGRDLRHRPDDDLGAFLRQDRVDRLGYQQANDARAGPRRPHARQVGRAGKALRSRQHDHGPEGALVSITRTGGKLESIGETGAASLTVPRKDLHGFRDDRDGDGEVAVVGDTDIDGASRQGGGGSHPDVRPPIVAWQNLDVAHSGTRNPAGHRLPDRLLGGPAPRPTLRTVAAVRDFAVAEELVQESIAEPLLGLGDAGNRRHIHADPRRHVPYSTVALLARLRGWSTLQPPSVAPQEVPSRKATT